MKLKGQQLAGANKDFIVIPRQGKEGENDIVLWAQAIMDYEPFEKLCPTPLPPAKITKGGTVYNLEDPDYKDSVNRYGDKRMAWIVLESLNLKENELEWETVKLGDHKTWLLFREEMKNAGFSATEIQRIEVHCYNVNCLTEARLDEARANFQLRVEAELKAASTTESSEPSLSK